MRKKKLLTLSVGILLVAVLLFAGIPTLADDAPTVHYDILITNGTVVDGTGAPRYQADVGIRDGKIVAIGKLAKGKAERVIDAEGLVVAPGVIDTHSHSETILLRDYRGLSFMHMGVTTLILGEVSGAPLPYSPEEGSWVSLAGLFKRLEDQGISLNYGSYVGKESVVDMVMGPVDRPPTEAELKFMKYLVAEAMEDGAFGLSSALAYAPSIFTSTETMIELAKVAAQYGGAYKSHVRGEDEYTLEPGHGIRELIDICIAAGLPGIVTHMKAPGIKCWEQKIMQKSIDLINETRAEGYDIVADMYPYQFGATSLRAVLPPWAVEGGTEAMLARLMDPVLRAEIRAGIYEEIELPYWFNFVMVCTGKDFSKIGFTSSPTGKNTDLEGKFFDEIALIRGYTEPDDAIEAIFDIIIEENGGGGMIIPAYFEESDIELAMREPWMAFCTDGVAYNPAWGGKPHPRYFGTYPRVLGVYVRERGIITLEDAVRKMTWLPAQQTGITDRGKIEVGLAADIFIFDPDTVIDKATYVDPLQYPEGIPYVMVNGVVVIDDGVHNGAAPGKILRLTDYPETIKMRRAKAGRL